MSKKAQIFVSCGQYVPEEKDLGKKICALIKELTPFEPYFAENQTSLDGLTDNILKALSESVGFIAVLHPRGTVNYSGGSSHTRASVWIEQEIAVAAYISQICKRNLHAKAFVHESVKREGMREFILLNPSGFSVAEDVLSNLRLVLPSWTPASTFQMDLRVTSTLRRIEGGIRYYTLEVTVTNNTDDIIERYYVDVLMPVTVLEGGISASALEVPSRRTATHRCYRANQSNSGRALYPGDPLRLMTLEYIDRGVPKLQETQTHTNVTATLYVPGQEPMAIEKDLCELAQPATTG